MIFCNDRGKTASVRIKGEDIHLDENGKIVFKNWKFQALYYLVNEFYNHASIKSSIATSSVVSLLKNVGFTFTTVTNQMTRQTHFMNAYTYTYLRETHTHAFTHNCRGIYVCAGISIHIHRHIQMHIHVYIYI